MIVQILYMYMMKNKYVQIHVKYVYEVYDLMLAELFIGGHHLPFKRVSLYYTNSSEVWGRMTIPQTDKKKS